MDETVILDHLEALAHTLEIEIRYECLESEVTFPSGGLCRLRDKHVIIVNKKAPAGEKAQTLARALRRFDLSKIYIRPALRDFLEDFEEVKE